MPYALTRCSKRMQICNALDGKKIVVIMHKRELLSAGGQPLQMDRNAKINFGVSFKNTYINKSNPDCF